MCVVRASIQKFHFSGKCYTFDLHNGINNNMSEWLHNIAPCFDFGAACGILQFWRNDTKCNNTVCLFSVLHLVHMEMERVMQLLLSITWIILSSSAWLPMITSIPHKGHFVLNTCAPRLARCCGSRIVIESNATLEIGLSSVTDL